MASIIKVREVWAFNLDCELSLLQNSLIEFPNLAMDTEFPGTIFHPTHIPPKAMSSLPPPLYYAIMKKNVDQLSLIQLGLTLSDDDGNLPGLSATGVGYIWQFNFRSFDPDKDPHNPESISLLQNQGMDFEKNKKHGIDCSVFANEFVRRVLSLNTVRIGFRTRNTTWVTFHGAYDFGFLIKILSQSELPNNLLEFMLSMRYFFGTHVFDAKVMGRAIGLHGGLDSMAKKLELVRAVGTSHQAGSDSLITMEVFREVRKKYDEINMRLHCEKLYGLSDSNFQSGFCLYSCSPNPVRKSFYRGHAIYRHVYPIFV